MWAVLEQSVWGFYQQPVGCVLGGRKVAEGRKVTEAELRSGLALDHIEKGLVVCKWQARHSAETLLAVVV